MKKEAISSKLEILETVDEYWDFIINEKERICNEYKNRGWETNELHPGDITVIFDREEMKTPGFDVLVPDNEFSIIEGMPRIKSYSMLANIVDGVVFNLIIYEIEASKEVILCPIYYSIPEFSKLKDAVQESGEFYVNIRTLNNGFIAIDHQDSDIILELETE